jgi:hypothetical protein
VQDVTVLFSTQAATGTLSSANVGTPMPEMRMPELAIAL